MGKGSAEPRQRVPPGIDFALNAAHATLVGKFGQHDEEAADDMPLGH